MGLPHTPQVVLCAMFVTMNQGCVEPPFARTVPRLGPFGSPQHHVRITGSNWILAANYGIFQVGFISAS